MIGEILQKLTGQYRGDRPTMESLLNGTAYQPQPEPMQPPTMEQLAQAQDRKRLSIETLAQPMRQMGRTASSVAGTVGDFLTGDDSRRRSEQLDYEIGQLTRRKADREQAEKNNLLMQTRALGQSSQARPFEIPTFDEKNQPITILAGADGREIARYPREVKQAEQRGPIFKEVTRGKRKYNAIWNDQTQSFEVAKGDEGTPLDTRTLKPLEQSEVADITNIESTAATMRKIEEAFGKMSGNKQGPIVGLLTGKNPYDEQIRELEKLIDMVTPSLARGVFREVGVLTDADIQRYRSMLPQAKTDPAIAKNILNQLKDKIQTTYTTALTNYGNAGRDVSNFDAKRQLFAPQVVPKGKYKVISR
jgi:hypothetical protein